MRRAGAILERARAYVAAARRTIGDVFDDLRDAPGRVEQDLRPMGRVFAIVDELASEATRQLASVDRQVLSDHGSRARILRLLLASDVRTLQAASASAHAAGRIAHDLAEEPSSLLAPAIRREREREPCQTQ